MWAITMVHWTSSYRDPSLPPLPLAGHGTSLYRDPSHQHWTSMLGDIPTHSLGHGTSLYRDPLSPAPPDMTSHCTGNTPVPGPRPLLVTSGGQDWRPVQICPLEDPQVLTSGAYARTVGKRVVRILLECFLVNLNFVFLLL